MVPLLGTDGPYHGIREKALADANAEGPDHGMQEGACRQPMDRISQMHIYIFTPRGAPQGNRQGNAIALYGPI